MMSPARITSLLLTALCGAMLCGCFPAGQSAMDEEKEPHFLAGRSRVNSMDFPGAIESFNEALEVNPRSAAAHLELGWLFEQKQPDPAAAIYHYEQYLKLRPGAADTETIKQRMFGLKQVLAQSVSGVPSSPGIQKELEKLMAENRVLREDLEKHKAYQATLEAALSNRVVQPVRAQVPARAPVPQNAVNGGSRDVRQVATISTPARTHKVQSGESPMSIARRYGVKVDTLLSVNPGVNPKRLRIGQVLRLPAT